MKQLHKFLFADSDQVVEELKLYLLDLSLKEADLGIKLLINLNPILAFIASKMFNSKESVLEFLRQNAQSNERLLSSVKKRIYELLV